MIFDCGLLDLYDQYIAADSPDLWGAFAIPSEAENIFSNLQSRRYLHLVNDVPMTCVMASALLLVRQNGVCSPHGTRWICALCCSPGINLCPVPTVIVLLVDHPLVIANKIKWHLLEALLSDILYVVM